MEARASVCDCARALLSRPVQPGPAVREGRGRWIVLGVSATSATGASGRAVMGWFSRAERGFALGVRHMAMPVGGALASLVLPAVAGAGGVRAALLALAGLVAVAAAAAMLWMREAP